MQQYNISAAEMEDAISRVLLKLKDQVLQDYLIEQQRAYQEALEASSTQENKEEDVNG
jgi:23S rRNA maturation-related 3'-5' exoribonuclease YhaM